MTTPELAERELEPPRRHRAWPLQRILMGFAAALVALAIVTAVFAQHASGWDLSWSAQAGGGGESFGSGYSMTGSIGQPVAGHSSGSGYTVDSGFLGGALERIFRLFAPFLATDGS